MKMKKHEPMVKPSDDGGGPEAPEVAVETKSGNITCSYGIHRGKFPVAGMKIKDARLVLKKLIKVDDSAAAVINGAVVDEETVILSDVTMLSFVKPSAVKGAVDEVITIRNRLVKMDGANALSVDKFCGLVASNTVSGLDPEPIPDNVKWIVRAGNLEMFIVELKPELRAIRWIDETDETGKIYKTRKLATPYVILAVPFVGGQLQTALELFYTTKPLKSLDDPLYHCNLLNVSMGRQVAGYHGLKVWVCTQYLNMKGVQGHADSLSEVISHIFGGGFNRSSDRSEGASGFSTYENDFGKGTNISNVDKWEEASAENPRFVLDVDWIKAGCTPRDLIDFRMKQFGVVQYPETSKALGNILLASRL